MGTAATTPTSSPLREGTGQQLYRKAKRLIPGGAQLLGKRQEMFAPEQWPTYFAEARGCEITDLDGRKFTDLSMCGIGATVLGYADPDVSAAVIERVERGVMCTLNPPNEVELAELMIELHPWAENVRFGRLGGETMAMAVRLARASTGRDKVAFCGYHGWHDWYLSANLPSDPDAGELEDRLGNWHLLPGLQPAGIPRGLRGSAMPFTYNRLDELEAIVRDDGDDLAAIVMEPTRNMEPEPGFLESVRDIARRCGARLVFDEVSIGWKLATGGAHLRYGVEPDLAVFAKTTGNGHPITAVVGKADTMQAAQETFISSALWTEAVGPAAGAACVKKMMRIDVPAHLGKVGAYLQRRVRESAEAHDIPLTVSGHPAMPSFTFEHPQAAALQTLWTVRMLDHDYLASGTCHIMLAHEERHVDGFAKACDAVFPVLRDAIAAGDIEARINGPVKHSGLQRLN